MPQFESGTVDSLETSASLVSLSTHKASIMENDKRFQYRLTVLKNHFIRLAHKHRTF